MSSSTNSQNKSTTFTPDTKGENPPGSYQKSSGAKSPHPDHQKPPKKPSLCSRLGSCIGRSCDEYIEYTGRTQGRHVGM
ncbi:hypothetical protein TWF281_009961 [Arthrobotrys megalospora]